MTSAMLLYGHQINPMTGTMLEKNSFCLADQELHLVLSNTIQI